MKSSNGRKRILLTLVRHGESKWNLENLFTGWTDVALTETGVSEAVHSGEMLLQRGQRYTLGYTSFLQRASLTYSYIVKELQKGSGFNPGLLDPRQSWRLNERHYGRLQGLNKAQTCEVYGKEQVTEWRRSFAVPPPMATSANEVIEQKIRAYSSTRAPILENLKRDLQGLYSSVSEISCQMEYLRGLGVFSDLSESDYAQYTSGVYNLYNGAALTAEQVAIIDQLEEYKEVRGESLQMTEARVKKWLRREYLRWGPDENVLIVAHGNSLRALIKTLEKISDAEIPKLNIPTGSPILYELDGLSVLDKVHALGEEEVKERARKVAMQASKK